MPGFENCQGCAQLGRVGPVVKEGEICATCDAERRAQPAIPGLGVDVKAPLVAQMLADGSFSSPPAEHARRPPATTWDEVARLEVNYDSALIVIDDLKRETARLKEELRAAAAWRVRFERLAVFVRMLTPPDDLDEWVRWLDALDDEADR